MALNLDNIDISIISLKIIKHLINSKNDSLFQLYLTHGFPQQIFSILRDQIPPKVMIDILFTYSFQSDEFCQFILNNFPENIFQIMANETIIPPYKIHLFYLLYSLSRLINPEDSNLVSSILNCVVSIYPFCSHKELRYSIILATLFCQSIETANIIAHTFSPFLPEEQIHILLADEGDLVEDITSNNNKIIENDFVDEFIEEESIEEESIEENNDDGERKIIQLSRFSTILESPKFEFNLGAQSNINFEQNFENDSQIFDEPKHQVIIWIMSEFIKSKTKKYIISGLQLATAFAKIPNPPHISLPIPRILDLSINPDISVAREACKFIEASIDNEVFLKLINSVFSFSKKFFNNLSKSNVEIKSLMLRSLAKLILKTDERTIIDMIKQNIVFFLIELFHIEDPEITKLSLKAISFLIDFHILDSDDDDIVLSDFQVAEGYEIIGSFQDSEDEEISTLATQIIQNISSNEMENEH